jgi:hypothetical protein
MDDAIDDGADAIEANEGKSSLSSSLSDGILEKSESELLSNISPNDTIPDRDAGMLVGGGDGDRDTTERTLDGDDDDAPDIVVPSSRDCKSVATCAIR